MPKTSVVIGLLCEADKDIAVAKIIIEKIAKLKSCKCLFQKDRSSSTGIEGDVIPWTKIFFKAAKSVEIGIYLTDKDRSSEKRKRIRRMLERHFPYESRYVALGVPDPHIEAWLMAKTDNVKRIFKITTRSYRPTKKNPKDELEYLYKKMPTPKISFHETYEMLAQNIDINFLKKNNPDFKEFFEELIEVIGVICK